MGGSGVFILDENELPQGISRTLNALDVSLQDQTTQVVDLLLMQTIQTMTLAGDISIDDTGGTVISDAQPTVGNYLIAKESGRFYQGQILTSVANGADWDITVDTPSDFAFTEAGATITEGNADIAVNGSVTPVTFQICPPVGTKWDVVRVIILLNTTAAPKDDYFGDSNVGALTNGMIFRKKDGEYFNIFNVKTNGELALRAYDIKLLDKSAGFGVICRRTFGGQSKNGVVIRLDGDTADEFQVVVRDDLRDLVDGAVVVQGHVVSGN